jgi:hypothetical protein
MPLLSGRSNTPHRDGNARVRDVMASGGEGTAGADVTPAPHGIMVAWH